MAKNIHILATGGTIASKALSQTSTVGYAPSVFGIEDLLAELPEMAHLAELSAEQIFKKQSPNFTDEDMMILGKRVQSLCDSEAVDGVVVLMGTDTMEEVSFFLHLTLKTDKPVVFTGAMRPAGVVSADGTLNILNAILVAAHDESRGKGVLVAMDDHILCARDVIKCSSFKTDAFRGGDYGVIGTIRNGCVNYYYQSVKKHTAGTEFHLDEIGELPQVEIIYMYQGCGDRILQAAMKDEIKGIIIAGFGNGAIHPDILEYYRQHRDDSLPVMVRACRAPYGGTAGDYGHFDEEIGSLPANDLTPQKARVLLRLALGKSQQRPEIIRMFSIY